MFRLITRYLSMNRSLYLEFKNDAFSEASVYENGRLTEYFTADNASVTGSKFYCAKVTEYAPGLGGSFLDCGDELRGFVPSVKLSPGQWFLAQGISEPHDKKGRRLSLKLRLPGSLCVLLSDSPSVCVSDKITDSDFREYLKEKGKEILESYPEGYGIIFRTGCPEKYTDAPDKFYSAIDNEYRLLYEKLINIRELFEISRKNGKIGLIYKEDITPLLINRYPGQTIDSIFTNNPGLEYFKQSDNVRYSAAPMELCGVHDELPRLLGRKIWLRSGAYIIIDKTEAMTVIDINSGKCSPGKDRNSFAKKINFEAAEEIMRTIRLRNTGGMILCDFIGMENESDGEDLLGFMRELAKEDRQTVEIPDITRLGIVEIVRKRTV